MNIIFYSTLIIMLFYLKPEFGISGLCFPPSFPILQMYRSQPIFGAKRVASIRKFVCGVYDRLRISKPENDQSVSKKVP